MGSSNIRAVHTPSLVNSRDSGASSCSAFSGAALNTRTIAEANKRAAGSAPQKMIVGLLQWSLPQQPDRTGQSLFANSITHSITYSITHSITHLIAWRANFGALFEVPFKSGNSSTGLSYRHSLNSGRIHILSLVELVQAPATHLRPCSTACRTDNSYGNFCPARMAKAPHETDCPSPACQPRLIVIMPITFKPVGKSTDEHSIKKPTEAGFSPQHTGLQPMCKPPLSEKSAPVA